MAKKESRVNDYDVIISGAGSTGLLLGLGLASQGVSFKIIDKRRELSQNSQAIGMQSRSLDILEDYGVLPQVLEKGVAIRTIKGLLERQKPYNINFSQELDGKYPYICIIKQVELENILVEALEEKGHKVEWGTELKTYKQSKDHVDVDIEREGKKQTIRASWIVGCDGKDSFVRKIAGIPVTQVGAKETFLLADIQLDWELAPNSAYGFIESNGYMFAVPLKDKRYRVMATIDQLIENVTLEDVQKCFKQLCPVKGSLKDPDWMTSFQVHRQIATQMRHKRVFLAGDAAHVHLPIGGQGMNSGLQDAYNLSWKLGHYFKGIVSEEFLDSYHAERHAVAQDTIYQTNFAMRVLTASSSLARKIRSFVAPAIINFPVLQNQLSKCFSQPPIHYVKSPIDHWNSENTKRYAQQLKDWFYGGVNVGDMAKPVKLLNPKDYKATDFSSLTKGNSYTLLAFLGDDPRKMGSAYKVFTFLKNSMKGFANAYFFVGEHAIDYNAFDASLEDIFIDKDGLGHTAYKCWDPTFYLIRPDGHVAYKGLIGKTGIKPYVNKHFKKKVTAPEKAEKSVAEAG